MICNHIIIIISIIIITNKRMRLLLMALFLFCFVFFCWCLTSGLHSSFSVDRQFCRYSLFFVGWWQKKFFQSPNTNTSKHWWWWWWRQKWMNVFSNYYIYIDMANYGHKTTITNYLLWWLNRWSSMTEWMEKRRDKKKIFQYQIHMKGNWMNQYQSNLFFK